jgi:hypothetical protein
MMMSNDHVTSEVSDPWWLADARRGQNKMFLMVVVAAAIGGTLGGALGLGNHPQHETHPNSHAWVAAVLLSVLVVIYFALFALWWWFRRRGVKWLQPSPLLALPRRRRRRVVRALRRAQLLPGGNQEANRDSTIALLTAERLVRRQRLVLQQAIFWFLISSASLTLVLNPDTGSWRWLFLAIPVFAILAVVQIATLRSGAIKYLAAAQAVERTNDEHPVTGEV